MTYVHAPLTSAHAQLISAPHVRGYDQTAEMIKQEQLRGLQIRNNMATAPQTVQPPQQQKAQQAMPRSSSDLALLMSQRDLVDARKRQLDEQTRGIRLGNDLQETKNAYAPGEYEADYLERVLGVKDKYSEIEDDRKMQNAIGEYIGRKRADVATKPVAKVGNENLQDIRDKLMDTVKVALSKKKIGLPVEDEIINVDLQDNLEPILKGSNQEYVPPQKNGNGNTVGYDVDTTQWEGGSQGDSGGGSQGVVSDGNFDI